MAGRIVSWLCLAVLVAACAAVPAFADDVGTNATATVASTTDTTTTAAAPAPCVGAGAIAIFEPGAAPILPPPSLAAATSTGVTASATVYPDDSSLLQVGSVRGGATGCSGDGKAPGGARIVLGALSVFAGTVTAHTIRTDLVPSTSSDGSGWQARTSVVGLRVDGVPTTLRSSLLVGDWGRIDSRARETSPGAPLPYSVGAFALVLLRAHGGYPAGTSVVVGYVSADVPGAAPPSQRHLAAPAKPSPKPAKRSSRKHKRRRPHSRPLKVTPVLKGGPYVFPVFGRVGFVDTYGAARSDVSGGWHHGDDIFAPLGAPIVAVASGTVYTIGWNEVGGWRLWLKDKQGNRFYYAHLSGYTKLARDNAHVKKGAVLAFVGNTGDAFTTPTHLHFEVHPVSLLHLGYDGAVDPTTYLEGWRHLAHVRVPRPAPLPAGAAEDGKGAVTDFRRLLAVRGLLPRKPRPAAPDHGSPPHELPRGAHEAAAAPLTRAAGDGWGPLAVAIAGGVLIAAGSLLVHPGIRRRTLSLRSRNTEDVGA